MAYADRQFCWFGIISTDPAKARSFYASVLGWGVVEAPMGDATATMFTAGGVPFAHLSPPPVEGMPSHWTQFLRVDDVDATTKAAVANGGTLMSPPMDIPPGRFSVVATPSGAAISVFHEADYDQAQDHPGGVGGVHWTELHSGDLDADVAWLKASFGFEISEMPIPTGKYYVLTAAGEQAGGAMQSFMPGAPPMWLSWVEVVDVDATAIKIGEHGGTVFGEPTDMPGVGRLVAASDPTGGVFGIITPARPS